MHYYNINTLSDLFQDTIENSVSNLWDSYNLSVGMDESDGKYELTCDLPGYEKSDISIKSRQGVLGIGASNELRGKRLKKITLPKDADESSIKAKLNNGVLKIQKKKKKEARAKEIKIE